MDTDSPGWEVERAHSQDLVDVAAMLERGLSDRGETRATFEWIEPELLRFPAIDPSSFGRRVENALDR